MQNLYSLVQSLEISPIREIAQWIDEARGDNKLWWRGTSLFPPPWLKEKVKEILDKDKRAFQYTATPGLWDVRESIVDYLRREGIERVGEFFER
jgi:aspartate/methionine/tyrosine aminotransferase